MTRRKVSAAVLLVIFSVASALGVAGCRARTPLVSELRPVEDHAQVGAGWVDRSPHRAGFVTANGARIHYLDWGGRGEAVVLLAGLTMTPHVYDALAPALTDRFRVVGITRRGHGESQRSTRGYQLDTLVADILAVLDSLHIARAHLIGHSIAGIELTAFALAHPGRVGKLVYLDAAVATPPDPPLRPMDDPVPEPPQPAGWETSLSLLRGWVSDALNRGRWSDALEANLRARHGGAGDRWRDALAPGVAAAMVQARRAFHPDLTAVPAPALGLYALAEEHPLINLVVDDATRRLAREYVEVRLKPLKEAVVAQFAALPSHRVVLVPGGADHYFFISQASLVVRELRAFLSDR